MSRIEGMDAFHKKLVRWSKLAPVELEKAIRVGAELIRREVQLKHLSGPRMPRGLGDPFNATLAVDTGTLRRSIALRVRVDKGSVSAEIGTSVRYGRIHELGRGGMPARPFLRSSLLAKRADALKLMEKAFLGAYKNAN